MIKSQKLFLKCSELKCRDIVSKEELEKTKNQHISNSNKKCKKHKIISKRVKCTQNSLSKSKYQKLLIEKNMCSFKKCAKEFAAFRKESAKKFKNNKKNNKKIKKTKKLKNKN